MADNRWNDDDRRDNRRGWTDRAGDEVRSWFGDDEAQRRRGNDERQDRYPYGGERSGRGQDESYDRGSSGWRGARDFGNDGSSRGGFESGGNRDYPRSQERDYNRGYGDTGQSYGQSYNTESHRGYDSGRGSGDYGSGYGDYGREDRQQYGRGGQYGSTSYDRGQLRRSYTDWTPGAAAGSRDWERGEQSGGWSGRNPGSGGQDYGYGQSGSGSASNWGRQSYAGRGPKGYRRSDERVREEVSDALTADPQVDASEISVQVENGEVTLTGSVASREQKRRAEDCAEGVSGVSDVTNNLRVNKDQQDRHDVSRLVTPSVVDQGGNTNR